MQCSAVQCSAVYLAGAGSLPLACTGGPGLYITLYTVQVDQGWTFPLNTKQVDQSSTLLRVNIALTLDLRVSGFKYFLWSKTYLKVNSLKNIPKKEEKEEAYCINTDENHLKWHLTFFV